MKTHSKGVSSLLDILENCDFNILFEFSGWLVGKGKSKSEKPKNRFKAFFQIEWMNKKSTTIFCF